MRTFEQPESGLLRTTVMQDQKDPARVFVWSSSRARRRLEPARLTLCARKAFRYSNGGRVGHLCVWGVGDERRRSRA